MSREEKDCFQVRVGDSATQNGDSDEPAKKKAVVDMDEDDMLLYGGDEKDQEKVSFQSFERY